MRLTVENFQSHRLTCLELDNPVVALVGANDSGKSAIARAITWLWFNKAPSGPFASWCHRGIRKGESTRVRLEGLPPEGSYVERWRNTTENGYRLFLNGETVEWNPVGVDVPKPVQDYLQVQSINLQSQGDPYFLIFNTAGQVAKAINSATGLDGIDRAISRVGSKVQEESRSLRSLEEELKQAEAGVSNYAGVDELEGVLATLRAQQGQLQGYRQQITAVRGVWDEASGLTKELSRYGEELPGLLAECVSIQGMRQEAERLSRERATMEQVFSQATGLMVWVQRVAGVEELLAEGTEVEGLLAKVQEARKAHQELSDGLRAWLTAAEQVSQLDRELSLAEKAWSKLEERGVPCPECGRPLGGHVHG